MAEILIRLTLCAAFVHLLAADASAGREELNVYKEADARALVSRVVEAYGGREKVEAVKSVYAAGTVTATMRQDHGTYTMHLERDTKLRVELKYGRSSELRILNKNACWQAMNGGALLSAPVFRYLAMLYQYKRLDLPYGLMTDWYKLRIVGEAVVNGRHADILSIVDDVGPPMDVYVDTATHMIVKVTGYFSVNGSYTDLTAEFSDYREVGGTKLPFRVTNYSGGEKIGETVIKEYAVNKPMKPSLFLP